MNEIHMHPDSVDSVQGAHVVARLVFLDLVHQCVCLTVMEGSVHLCRLPAPRPCDPLSNEILSYCTQDIYDPDGYECLFPAMIRDWRKKFINANQLGDMAFGFTQLAG